MKPKNLTSLEELTDKHIGKRGTLRREIFEGKYKYV